MIRAGAPAQRCPARSLVKGGDILDLVMGAMLGLVVSFVFYRLADKTCKDAASDCGYDCSLCSCHCVGFHCHEMRQARAEHGNTEDVAADVAGD